jgi:rRNA maturation RNase YbeY
MLPKANTRIQLSFVGSRESRSLNKKFLKHDYPTDVLSFNIDETLPDGSFYLGDIVINLDMAKTEREIARLAEHGIRHLLGIHHK